MASRGMAEDHNITVAASATMGLAALFGIIAMLWRRIRRVWRAFWSLFGLERRLDGLDGRMGTMEHDHVTRDQMTQLRTDVDKRISRHERVATAAIKEVKAELREQRSFMARADDVKRVEGKVDELLVRLSTSH